MKKSNKSIVVIGVFLVAIFLSIRLINNKREEVYELDSSNNLKEVESKGIAILYKDSDNDEYKETDTIPKGNYEVDNDQSYCLKNGSESRIQTMMEYKDNKVYIKADSSGLKCFVYLKKTKEPTAEDTLDNLGIDTSTLSTIDESEFNKTVCARNTNDSTHKSGNCDLSNSGIFKGTDDYGTTYYYRGTVDNNWVTFANKWWRIIRINGNGSIRLIYSGSKKPTDGRWADGTDSKISTSDFNDTDDYNDNKYVGYMYGNTSENYKDAHTNTNSSTIKIALDNWYSKNMDAYTDQLDGSVGFCNDRTPYNEASANSTVDTSKSGFGSKYTLYGAYIRTWIKNIPSFNCPQSANDLFTMSGAEQGVGNGKLTYPVGLITVDEAMFAGSGTDKNYGYWLYTGFDYWTMSPRWFNNSSAGEFYVENTGYIAYIEVYCSLGVRPVINLRSDTVFTTSSEDNKGTVQNPYIVS